MVMLKKVTTVTRKAVKAVSFIWDLSVNPETNEYTVVGWRRGVQYLILLPLMGVGFVVGVAGSLVLFFGSIVVIFSPSLPVPVRVLGALVLCTFLVLGAVNGE